MATRGPSATGQRLGFWQKKVAVGMVVGMVGYLWVHRCVMIYPCYRWYDTYIDTHIYLFLFLIYNKYMIMCVFMLFLFNHFLVDVLYLGGLADLLKFWRRSVDLFSGHVFLCVRCEPGQKTNREVCCFFLGVGPGKVKPFKDEALTMRTSNFQPCLLLGLAALHGVFFASLAHRGIVHCVCIILD